MDFDAQVHLPAGDLAILRHRLDRVGDHLDMALIQGLFAARIEERRQVPDRSEAHFFVDKNRFYIFNFHE